MDQPKNQALRIERFDYRLTFAKKGRARYISHLDLMRTMQRAFKRAGIPIWYTQGFNPHAYLMFPLALSLGTESEVEILDIGLTEKLDYDDLVCRLNRSMPDGLYFVKAAAVVKKHTEIACSEYIIQLDCALSPDELLAKWNAFISQNEINIEKRVKPKKGKKPGFKLVNIKEHINVLSANTTDSGIEVQMRLPSGVSFNLNTAAVTDAFTAYAGIEPTRLCTKRTRILCEDGTIFI